MTSPRRTTWCRWGAELASGPELPRWADPEPESRPVASAHDLPREYARSMRARVTVTVDEEAVRAAEAAVAAGRAPSVSAWVASAMSERAHREKLADVLSEIRAQLGPATEEETAWARSILGL